MPEQVDGALRSSVPSESLLIAVPEVDPRCRCRFRLRTGSTHAKTIPTTLMKQRKRLLFHTKHRNFPSLTPDLRGCTFVEQAQIPDGVLLQADQLDRHG